MQPKNKFVDLLSRIIFVLGIAIGIMFTAVGTIMIVNASLKLAFFDAPRYSNVEWKISECENETVSEGKITRAVKTDNDLTEEEIEKCKKEAETNAKADFEREEKETIVDGISSLFVGLLLWIAFGLWGRRVKKNKNDLTPPKPHQDHPESPHHA